MAEYTPDETLDARGLSCPMPLLKTKKQLAKMQSGQVLEVLGTDPGTKNDLPSFCKRSGDEYLGEAEDSGFFRMYIKKG
ncbi:MAG: sulfurtransferase TusA family protein [Proteobacteria bacterium]|nr:sulfurtransferase TusA family protein [Pseudomonadota bacterium]MBU1742077.1 sulfurtransferase TusA family protein [Pseudomonadota bacterium]